MGAEMRYVGRETTLVTYHLLSSTHSIAQSNRTQKMRTYEYIHRKPLKIQYFFFKANHH